LRRRHDGRALHAALRRAPGRARAHARRAAAGAASGDGTGMSMATVVFLVTLAVLAYHYAGYPITLALIAWWRRPAPIRPGREPPDVTLVIAAYNEEGVLRRKLENALALDYPRERLEILVASDGSTDRTTAIAREFAERGVVLHEYRTNRGKNAALN